MQVCLCYHSCRFPQPVSCHIPKVKFRCFSDLFAIFKTTEKLERAYVRDAISSKEYEPACQKLIGQYKTLWETLRDTVCCMHAYICCYTACDTVVTSVLGAQDSSQDMQKPRLLQK